MSALRRVVLLLAVCVCAAGAAIAASPASAAAATRACSAPKYPGSGYFTSLRVTSTSCTTGKRIALGYYRCRVKGGRSGRCRSRVSGYRCIERRQSISTEFNARVTCKRGSRRVVHTYQQNT